MAVNDKTKSSTIEYLNTIDHTIKENIINVEKQLDNLASKGCIAKEHGDREYEQVLEVFQTKLLETLTELVTSQGVLQELFEAVHSDLFFSRFNSLLKSELGTTETRLLLLYFVDKILVSSENPIKIMFKESPFASFHLTDAGQSTET
ncbi:hypothetical protein QNH47_12735 [Virgibacillus halodenitrificans]|uniref:hypothetical protein n=1 Tax=Virgibacillus halodenitrificans TaxID=1482 RepID=UPI0024BF208F|nr:hypothetical protein [Virgibacillus halodenitrificans]WHX25033.1 hypothetical protein QNH47_12735 [Virgibacillus halodenitrificans]